MNEMNEKFIRAHNVTQVVKKHKKEYHTSLQPLNNNNLVCNLAPLRRTLYARLSLIIFQPQILYR